MEELYFVSECLCLKLCVKQIETFGYHNMKHRLFVEFVVEEKEEY